MNITVINGSPKGNKHSVTMLHVAFLKKLFPEANFELYPVAQQIRKFENDKEYFDTTLDSISQADAIIWAVPVYFFVVPAQFKRFMELLFERKTEHVFKNKHVTSIITSARIFDYIAENYLHAVSEDLGMNYSNGFLFESAIDLDLLKKDIHISYKQWGEAFFDIVKRNQPVPKRFLPVIKSQPLYSLPKMENKSKISSNHKITIVTDHEKGSNLHNMVQVLENSIGYDITVFNINSHKVNPCIGCIKCFFGGKCIHKDDFKDLFFEKVISADVIIYAATIKDRFLSSGMKKFIDREIVNGWCDRFKNKKVGYLISGPLRDNENIFQCLQLYASHQLMDLLGIVSDEYENEDDITNLLTNLGKKIERSYNDGRIIPQSFFRKSFQMYTRDILWVFSATHPFDYNYYKKNKLFDFVTHSFKQRRMRWFYNLLFRIPPVMKFLLDIGSLCLLVPYKKFIKKNNLTSINSELSDFPITKEVYENGINDEAKVKVVS